MTETCISYEDFRKLQIVTARILAVREHPDADRLYLLQVDMGGEVRQIVAGIRADYAPETLLGRDIVVLKNLEPRKIRGQWSAGMLLAASDGDGIVLLQPNRAMTPGSVIH